MTVAAATRQLTVSYGGYTVSPDGHVRIEKAFDRASVEFDFMLTASTAVAFAAAVNAAEVAYRAVRVSCAVTQESQVLASFSHSGYTGFDSYATVMKREDVGDTGRSRRYTVRIDFGMPADTSSTSGRRSSTVTVTYSPARRRTVTISGVYTGLSGAGSRAQYSASIVAYTTAVLSSLTGTFELVEEPVAETNIGDSLCVFTRVFQELIYFQGSTLDDAQIVRQVLTFTRNQPSPGDTMAPGSVQRMIMITANYECWIDKTLTQALKSKYDSAIKPFILARAASTMGVSTVAVMDEAPTFDMTDNRISCRMDIAAVGSSKVLESKITTEDTAIYGTVLIPVWAKSKNPLVKYAFAGPAQLQRRIVESRRFVGTMAAPFSTGVNELIQRPTGIGDNPAPSVAVVSSREGQTPLRIGIAPNQFDVVDYTRETTLEFFGDYKPETLAAGGGDVQKGIGAVAAGAAGGAVADSPNYPVPNSFGAGSPPGGGQKFIGPAGLGK